jgi:predicted MPP superfamily phosphohydrolase
MENDGEGRFPQLGNINQTLFSINHDAFVVMLEHDPTSWRRKILPNSHCQLALSGHTHGGQFSILGFTPAMFTYRDYQGMCYVGKRAMNVSTGLGGVVPIRFGVTPEIVVITLKSSK